MKPSKDQNKVDSKPVTDIPPEPSKNAPLRSKASEARERGRSMGMGFATLNGETMQRSENIGDAVRIGQANAARDDDREASIAQSDDALREMGFWGRSRDDDF